MKKQKIMILLTLICLLVLLFVPFVSASAVCPAAFNPSSTLSGTAVNAVHPSSTIYPSAAGEAFTANATCYLYNVTFSLAKTGPVTGFYVAKLYSIASGTVGTNAYPSTTVLATSEFLNPASLSADLLPYTIDFYDNYQLQSGTSYFIDLEATNQTVTSSYYVNMGTQTGYAEGNRAIYSSSTWSTSATYDLYYIINGNTESLAPTSTPTPPATTPTPTSTDGITNTINALTSNILTFIALALILIPAIIGAKFAGGWGFLAGLNVGVGLVFIFSVISGSLWFVVMIGIVDAVAVIRGMSGSGKTETVTKGE